MTAASTRRGLAHRCPLCGEEDGLSVRVCDGVIQCCGCDGELTPEELEALDGRAAETAERYRRALVKIAAYGAGEWGPHMDEPAAAYEARAALGDEPA